MELINKLTDRGLLPTPQIVKNLAEKIRGEPVAVNLLVELSELSHPTESVGYVISPVGPYPVE